MGDDGIYGDDPPPPCPECQAESQWSVCWQCSGEAGWDLYESDPIQRAPGEWEECDFCDGKGGYWVCTDRECPRVIAAFA